MLIGKHVHSKDPSASHEHYLRGIWEVRSRQGYARLTDVAKALGISPPTLSAGLKPLEARGLVAHDPHRFLILTREGERIAREVHHRFAVVLAFMRDVLGVPEERALTEACLIEHDVSADTTERLLDLIKLLREDGELRAFFERRFSSYHRSCSPSAECSTCGLACLSEGGATS
jgi:DtxR family Mn-dependent transcriptional regulator